MFDIDLRWSPNFQRLRAWQTSNFRNVLRSLPMRGKSSSIVFLSFRSSYSPNLSTPLSLFVSSSYPYRSSVDAPPYTTKSPMTEVPPPTTPQPFTYLYPSLYPYRYPYKPRFPECKVFLLAPIHLLSCGLIRPLNLFYFKLQW